MASGDGLPDPWSDAQESGLEASRTFEWGRELAPCARGASQAPDEGQERMTADEAGQSWLDRTTAIATEFQDANYSREAVHNEAQLAMQGINQLLEHRYNELSPQMVEWLYQAVDTNDKIQKDTLEATFQSPWSAGASEFGTALKQEAAAGVQGVKQAAKDVAKAVSVDFTIIAIAAVAIGLLFILVNAKTQSVLA
jgi:hypothetical protein